MSESARRSRTLLLLSLGVLVVLGLYQGVMVYIRSHVNERIHAKEGQSLHRFTLELAGGGTLDSDSLRGKTVVLNFFRSHCGGCEAEREAVAKLAGELDPDRAVVVGIMTDRVMGFAAADTAATLKRHAPEHRIAFADDAFLEEFHGGRWARVTPITYFVSPAGNIVHSLRGTQTLESLREGLALAQNPGAPPLTD